MNDDTRQTLPLNHEPSVHEEIQHADNRQGARLSSSSGPVDMQFASSLDRLILPSPEAAKAARHADFPVSHSLGTADISIPIHEIHCGRLSHSIRLAYNTSGVKVEEISGITGLGWRLCAGGVITRSIAGRPDESQGGQSGVIDAFTEYSDSNYATLLGIASGNTDCHRDRYSYNFCGRSGSFFLDYTSSSLGVVHLTPTGMKIAREGMGFTITDTDGTVYRFTAAETTSKVVGVPTPTPYAPSTSQYENIPTGTVTAWYLTEIVSMDGRDRITFQYTTLSQITTRHESDHRSHIMQYKFLESDGTHLWKHVEAPDGVPQFGAANTPDIEWADWTYRIDNSYSPLALSLIAFDGGRVEFGYTANAQAASGTGVYRSYANLLTSIKVSHETVANSFSALRTTHLSYDDTNDRRKLLRTVKTCEGSCTGTACGDVIESYTMDYYDPGTNMAARSQDLFGYYNGKTNPTMLPFSLFPDSVTLNDFHGDRSYSFTHARALSLSSVRTATGARTAIAYEANSVAAGGGSILQAIGIGIRVKSIDVYDVTTAGSGASATTTETLIRRRMFTYSDPSLTIPAYSFTPDRFITASEHNSADAYTIDKAYSGHQSPVRTCTVTIADQSVCPGAPLESALIVYGKVEERIMDGASSREYAVEHIFDTSACRNMPYSDATTPDAGHDEAFLLSASHASGFHFYQRVPNAIPRPGMSPSVALGHPAYYFRETNRPMLGRPSATRKYLVAGSSRTLYEETVHTYAAVTEQKQTGFSARLLLSVNTDGRQNSMARHICDFHQTEIVADVVYARLEASVTRTYDGGDMTEVRTVYGYSPGAFGGGNSMVSAPQRNQLTAANCNGIHFPRLVETTVTGNPSRTYRRYIILPEDYTSGSGCTYASALRDAGFRQAVGEVMVMDGGMTRGLFTSYDSGALRPTGQREYINGTDTSNNTDIDGVVRITAFDAMGNPAEIHEYGKPVRSLVWGYHGKHIIAEVTGADIAAVNAALAGRGYTPSSVPDESSLLGIWDALSQAPSLSGAQITVMTYSQHVGVTSMKDPAGRRTVFTYDPAGRLTGKRMITDGTSAQGDMTDKYSYDFTRSDGRSNAVVHLTFTSPSGADDDARKDVSRYDGLGRRVQDIAVRASGQDGYNDIITLHGTDFMDHEDAVSYLPFAVASDGGRFRINATAPQQAMYNLQYGIGVKASVRTEYEVSDRNRVKSMLLPGFEADSDRTEQTVSRSGAAEVPDVSMSGNTLTRSGYHAPGQLLKTTTSGPDGSVSQVFTNDFGSPVLERRLISGSTVWSATLYVRDQLDRVICVIPPDEYNALASAGSITDERCYVYKYNEHDQVESRHLPGVQNVTAYEYYGNGLIKKETCGDRTVDFTFDCCHRITSMRYRYGSGTAVTLEECLYDTVAPGSALAFVAQTGFDSHRSQKTRGMKTWERIRVITPAETQSTMTADSSAAFVERAFHYDGWGRCIQIVEKGPDGMVTRRSMKYSYTGEMMASAEAVSVSGAQASAMESRTLDRRDRVTGVTVSAMGATATVSYGYDGIGRLQTTKLGGASVPVETINDSYTVQGWMAERSSSRFTSQLRYDNPAHGSTPALPGKAGNITEWRTYRNGSTASGSTYAFTYDLMSRLKSSSRYAGNSSSATSPYTEKNITYFADSRIKTIKRYGPSSSSVQDLSFATDGNSYDSFGNVTLDAHSGASILWNILNLPRKITTAGGTVTEFTYLADGTKFRMKSGSTTVHYVGGMVFSQAGSATPVFESAAFCEGRIVGTAGGGAEVHYHIKDHLGSVRTVLKADGTVIATNDYYPYGKRINTASATAPSQKDRFTFSGKEDQALTPGGAPYLDFGARMYSPETGRWLSVDPMAEKYYGIGMHVYCAGNPIMRIEIDGMYWHIVGGAIAGAVIEGGVALVKGSSGREIIGASLKGAVAGATMAASPAKALMKGASSLGKSLAINAIDSAIASSAGSVVEQKVVDGSINPTNTAVDTVVGVVLSAFTPGTKFYATGKLNKVVDSEVFKNDVANSVKDDFTARGIKESKATINRVTCNKIKSIVEGEIQTISTLGTIVDYSVMMPLSDEISNKIKERIE